MLKTQDYIKQNCTFTSVNYMYPEYNGGWGILFVTCLRPHPHSNNSIAQSLWHILFISMHKPIHWEINHDIYTRNVATRAYNIYILKPPGCSALVQGMDR